MNPRRSTHNGKAASGYSAAPERKPYRHAGFTLLELIIVVAIIAVIGMAAVPELLDNWLPNRRLRQATQDLYANLQRAKLGAVKNNKQWAVLFDAAGNSYTVCENYDSTNAGCGDEPAPTDERVVATVILASYGSVVQYGHGSATAPIGATFDNEITFGADKVEFNPNGMAGGMGYVYLQNSFNTTTYGVGVNTLAGNIVLRKWLSGSWQ